jgi:hypothetical protein
MRDRLMPRDLGTWNPRDCLVCVIDDAVSARQAARALHRAGYADHNVRLALAAEIVALDDARLGRGLFTRIVTGLRALGDEGLVTEEYAAAARRGQQVLIVHAPGETRAQRAHAIVARHRAHTVHFFGRWVIRALI